MSDYPLAMIRAEIASGKATIRSLGVLYMVAMASRSSRSADGQPFSDFSDINNAIMDFRKPNGSSAERAMSLDPVKKIAWSLYETIAKAGQP